MKSLIKKIARSILYRLNVGKFGHLDKTSRVSPGNIHFYSKRNTFLYENISLGDGAIIMNTRAKFIMKRNSIASIQLLAVTGNHMLVPGMLFKDVTDSIKNQLDVDHKCDQDIVVDEDVWIGARVTLLNGVTIGRSAVVSAGAVVAKDIPPYAIAGGVPAKVIKFKWPIETILEHEKKLYPENERLTKEYLEEIFAKYSRK